MVRARSPLAVVTATLFLDFVGLTLVIPLLPLWAERLDIGPRLLGVVAAGYAVTQVGLAPLVGALSDRYGRRAVIAVSLLVEATGFALTALAGTWPLLLVARLISGAGAANVGAAQAVAADSAPPQRRARAMGVIGAAIGAAHIVGPALGGLLGSISLVTVFWLAAALAVGNAAGVWWLLPETRTAASAERATGVPAAAPMPEPDGARRIRVVVLTVTVLFTVAMLAVETVFALFTRHRAGWGAGANGAAFAFSGATVVAIQLLAVGPLTARFGNPRLLFAGLAVLTIGFALIGAGPAMPVVIAGLGLVGAGMGLAGPAATTLYSLAARPGAQGRALGFYQSVAGTGRLAGPVLAGLLFAAAPAGPFLAGAALCALAAALALMLLRRTADRTTTSATPAHR